MVTNRREDGAERGSAMVGVLAALVLMGGMSMLMLHVGLSFTREQGQRVDETSSLYLAESVLAQAVQSIREGGDGRLGSRNQPAEVGSGIVWTNARALDATTIEVTACGLYESGRAGVRAVVQRAAVNRYPFGVFSRESLVIQSSAKVDGWDPDLGTSYADQLSAGQNEVGTVGSNGDITLEAASRVYGDAYPGPEGAVYQDFGNSVSNAIVPLEEELVFETVTTPDIPMSGLPDGSGLVQKLIPERGIESLAPGEYRFDRLGVGRNAELTVRGPSTIVLEDLALVGGANLILDASGGPIEIYVSDELLMPSNSSVTTPDGSAKDVEFLLTGDETQEVVFSSNALFYGTLYGPLATLTVESNFEVFGALSGRVATLASNCKLHFDRSLLEGSPDDFEVELQAWEPVAFPDQDLLVRRGDPFEVLQVERGALPSPGDLRVAARPVASRQ